VCICVSSVNGPECDNGIDDDNDGSTDFPADPGCESVTDNTEVDPLTECEDNIDNDGDGVTDLDDPGCENAQDDDESDGTTECQDGEDNDGDGLTDLDDPGCDNAQDNDESDGTTQCQDGEDNDNDGLTDLDDPGCENAQDDDEFNVTPEADLSIVKVQKDNETSLPRGGTAIYEVTVTNNGPDTATLVTVIDEIDRPWPFNASESSSSCVVSVDNKVLCNGITLALGEEHTFTIAFDVPLEAPCGGVATNTASVAADPSITDPVSSNNVDTQATTVFCAECQDGIDNDNDGATDHPEDFSCDSPEDNDETNDKAACQDGVDNDGDGLTDFPEDAGCSSAQDDDERDANGPECDNGVDDDGDGIIDFPADPGCTGPTDNEEEDPLTQCEDGIDNDGDGLTDLDDPGCENPQDDDESDDPTPQADLSIVKVQQDGGDSAQRGGTAIYEVTVTNSGPATATDVTVIDTINRPWPFNSALSSPDCLVGTDNTVLCDGLTLASDENFTFILAFDVPDGAPCGGVATNTARIAADPSLNDPNPENNEATQATTVFCSQCQDGVDNDGDGATDFPADPGCFDKNDDDESDGTTQCQDGSDNDGDGLTDLDDPGCSDENDDDESDGTTQCQDGIDNDGDGLTDLDDPGCDSPQDNDESDATSQCQDGIDNDNDGLTDFPEDPGCSSAQDNDEVNVAEVIPEADLVISKSVNEATVSLNGSVVYTLTVTNSGSFTATGAVVTDPVPSANLTYNAALSTAGCAFDDGTSDPHGTVVCNGSLNIAAGETEVFTLVFDVSSAASCGSVFTNKATVVSLTNEADVSDNTSEEVEVEVSCTQCQDGIDNDGDGDIDAEDLGCLDEDDNYVPENNNEADECRGMNATIRVVNGIIRGGDQDGEVFVEDLLGTPGNDVIVGTAGYDDIDARGGDDIICARGGDDDIQGDSGNDIIEGGGGDDTIQGDDGDDELHGGEGNDELQGDSGADILCGDAGNDEINGNSESDRISGGDGDDIIDAGANDDEINGGPGFDMINGGFDNDICINGEDIEKCEDETSPVIITECGDSDIISDEVQIEVVVASAVSSDENTGNGSVAPVVAEIVVQEEIEEEEEEEEEVLDFLYACSDGSLHLDASRGSRSDLYLVNETTGVSSLVQIFRGSSATALAADSNGALYALEKTVENTTGNLVMLNRDGTVTDVGPTGVSGLITALGFGSDGTLYALEEETGTLYSLDTETGLAQSLHTFASLDVRGGDLVVNAENQILYVSRSGEVSLIDLNDEVLFIRSRGSLTQEGRFYESLTLSAGVYYAADEVFNELHAFTLNPFVASLVSRTSGPFGPGDGASCPTEPAPVVSVTTNTEDDGVQTTQLTEDGSEVTTPGRYHRKRFRYFTEENTNEVTEENTEENSSTTEGSSVETDTFVGNSQVVEEDNSLSAQIQRACAIGATMFRPDGRPYKCRRNGGELVLPGG